MSMISTPGIRNSSRRPQRSLPTPEVKLQTGGEFKQGKTTRGETPEAE